MHTRRGKTPRDNERLPLTSPTVHSFVINLARRVDRRERMELRLQAHSFPGWMFVEGLDARELSTPPEGTLTSLTLYSAWTSHTRAMEKIHQGDADFGLVLEDDAVFNSAVDWPVTLEAIEGFMSSERIDYLQIGHISAAYPKRPFSGLVSQFAGRRNARPQQVIPELGKSVELGVSRAGAHAYVISRRLSGLAPKYNTPTWVGPDGFFDRFASATFADGSLLMGTLTESLVEQESREYVGSQIDSDNFS